ncbi:MAG: hydrolase [Bdellovibrio sp.]
MRTFIFLVLLFSGSPVAVEDRAFYFVIWNVGQGQWATAILPDHCLHFDMGGEFFPWKKIARACRHKENRIHLSHWDWDHIGALARPSRLFNAESFCLALPPQGKSSRRKEQIVQTYHPCTSDIFNMETVTPTTDTAANKTKTSLHLWRAPSGLKETNQRSHVLQFHNILIPGDSPFSQEKIWSQQKWVHTSRVLLLGHHGSQTSTSTFLLDNLPSLKLAISSARWARYHHPHGLIEHRLRQRKIPLLKTEDWGSIWLKLTPSRD